MMRLYDVVQAIRDEDTRMAWNIPARSPDIGEITPVPMSTIIRFRALPGMLDPGAVAAQREYAAQRAACLAAGGAWNVTDRTCSTDREKTERDETGMSAGAKVALGAGIFAAAGGLGYLWYRSRSRK